MKIPKRFKLMGQTIEVVREQTMLETLDCNGEARYRLNQIAIQPNNAGVHRPDSYWEQVFLHELMHWIFYQMHEPELRANEKIVDLVASLLHQALTTAEYEETEDTQEKG